MEKQMNEREAAEQEYTVSAFDYPRNPVGSRDWTLFWQGWQARAAAPAVQEPVAVVRIHKTGGNAGIAWTAHPLDDAPLMRDGDPLYAAAQAVNTAGVKGLDRG
jgi:hypothetical protein